MTNPIADPLVEVADTDLITDLVLIDATPAGAVTVTLNRPERKNALNDAMLAGLAEAFETLHAQDGVRVVFVRGAGGVFCTGGDPEWLQVTADHTEQDNRDDFFLMARMLKALHDIPALTVALVEGGASGAGRGSPAPATWRSARPRPSSPSPRCAWACCRPPSAPMWSPPSGPGRPAASSPPAAASTPPTPSGSAW